MNLTNKFDKSVSMLAWGYNEESIVYSFLERAFEMLGNNISEYELIFVDDGSTDRTGAIVSEYARNKPQLRVITNDRNMNIGISAQRAITAARKEFLFWQTVDWSYNLSNIRFFLELLKHFDVIQGFRPLTKRSPDSSWQLFTFSRLKGRSDNWQKAFVSVINYHLIRILYGVDFQDFQNVSFYPTKTVQSLQLKSHSSFSNPELLIKAYNASACFLEVPIAFLPRQKGKAKGTKISSVYRAIKEIMVNWLQWGLRGRLHRSINHNTIYKINEPSLLSDDVLQIIKPLIKDIYT
jgi:glycosyltransferase involved in cell wall biosynthesis